MDNKTWQCLRQKSWGDRRANSGCTRLSIKNKCIQEVLDDPQRSQSGSLSKDVVKQETQMTTLLNDSDPGTSSCSHSVIFLVVKQIEPQLRVWVSCGGSGKVHEKWREILHKSARTELKSSWFEFYNCSPVKDFHQFTEREIISWVAGTEIKSWRFQLHSCSPKKEFSCLPFYLSSCSPTKNSPSMDGGKDKFPTWGKSLIWLQEWS